MLLIANSDAGASHDAAVPQDYTIEDTWFVSGLKGTGSKDILVDDVFVPGYRTVPMTRLREGNAPGRAVHDTPNQRIPQQCILPLALASPIIGMAQGAIDSFEERLRHGTSAREGNPLAELTSYQLRLAESAVEVYAARAIMHRDCAEMFERARRSELPSVEDRARYRRDHAYVARLSVRALTGSSRSAAATGFTRTIPCSASTGTPTPPPITWACRGTCWPSSTDG